MVHENDLYELGGRLLDAAESLIEAGRLAMKIAGDGSDPEDPGWPAMAKLVDRIGALTLLVSELPGDEITGAIGKAKAHIDEMSDRADGVSC